MTAKNRVIMYFKVWPSSEVETHENAWRGKKKEKSHTHLFKILWERLEGCEDI